MRRTGKRLGALLLALVMVLSLVPMTALAARIDEAEVALEAPDAPQAAQTAELPGGAEDGPAQLLSTEHTVYSRPYTRLTGTTIEPGNYIITTGTHYLHNTNGTTADRCGSVSPSNNTLAPGHDNDVHNPYDHVWKIAGNATDGYTIQSATTTASEQNYLTLASGAASDTRPTLTARADTGGTQTFTITPANNDASNNTFYIVNSEKYLKMGSSYWVFSDTLTALQLYQAASTTMTLPLTDAADGTHDVGWDGTEYSNPVTEALSGNDVQGTVITAAAFSSNTGANQDSGPGWAVVSGFDPTSPLSASHMVWHSSYTAESNRENRWFELTIADGPVWLAGLRYYPKAGKLDDGNGAVKQCDIRIPDANGSWVSVTSTHDWTLSTNNWYYKQFDRPVQVQKVRLYGYETRNNFMNAAAVRLVKADTVATHSVQITVQGTDNRPIANATVTMDGRTFTTNEYGVATVTELVDAQEYRGTVTASNFFFGTVTVTAAENATATVTLNPIMTTVTVTVTDGADQALAGAKVELVQDNDAKSFATAVSAQTTGADGAAELNVNVEALAAGTYLVRVSKDGYGAKIDTETPITIARVENTTGANISSVSVSLPIIETAANETTGITKTFLYDMSSVKPTLAMSNPAKVTSDYTTGENPALELIFAARNPVDENTRSNRLVTLTGTNFGNGVIEFDATRAGTGTGRFGLAMRKAEGDKSWIYVGQEDANDKWFYEFWNQTTDTWNTRYLESNSMPVKVSFAPGDTRHFKVTLQGTRISLDVDGIPILNDLEMAATDSQNRPLTPPMDAKDVGFICGNGNNGVPATITIDNLYVLRKDEAQTVTLEQIAENKPLTAKVVTSASPDGEALTNGKAMAGDVIRVTCEGMDTGKALGGITVKKTDDATTTVPAEQVETGVWQFPMPEYAVTVTGEEKSTLTPTLAGTLKVGGQMNVTLAEENASAGYEWFRKATTANAGWVKITDNADGASYTPVAADQNHYLKVKVTGTGSFTGIYELDTTELTPNTVGAADVQITGFGTHRNAIVMWLNDSTKGNTGDEVGTATTLNLTLNPALQEGQSYESYTITWASSNTAVATVTAQSDTLKADLAAVGVGTTTITATLSHAGGADITATCTVTVKSKPESIRVMKGSTEVTVAAPLVLYTNKKADSDEPIDASHPNSAGLTLAIDPETASEKGFTWLRDDGATGLITVDRHNDNNTECDIAVTGISETNVGEKTVTVTSTTDSNVTASFKVVVRRYLEHDVSIGGTAIKVGSQLSANINALVMTNEGKEALTYQWYRLDAAGDALTDANKITGAESKEYTLAVDDFDKFIAVKVTADTSTFYEGEKTAVTATKVAETDGPAAPTDLQGVACTKDGNDGKITGLTANATYDIQKQNGATWEDVGSGQATATADNAITGLEAGNYRVRIPADNTNKVAAGAWSTVITVSAYNAPTTYTITFSSSNQHVTATANVSAAEEGATVTITATPEAGWSISNVNYQTGGTGTTIQQTPGKNEWTFQMPAEAVTINITTTQIKVTITHALTGVTCDVTDHTTENTHVVNYGEVHTITLTAQTGYNLPANVKVTKTGSEENLVGTDAVQYNNSTGKITFTNGVTEDITVTAVGTPISYAVSYTLTAGGLTGPDAATRKVNHGQTYTGTITPNTGWSRPTTITVTMAGTTLEEGEGKGYTYNSSTGEIKVFNVTGNVAITAAGVKNKTAITAATISNVAQVGNQLSVTVTPAGATADYQWQVCATADGTFTDIVGATAQTYTLTGNEGNKYVRAVLTGKGDYSTPEGGLTSNVVGPVNVPATGITLDMTSKSVTVGDADFTLTATVTPSDATDRTVTWSTVNATTAEADTSGVVQLTDNGDGTVTVRALKAGTVRVRATNSAGVNAHCTVTVERAASNVIVATADNVSVVHDGQPHSITVSITQPAEGAGCRILYRTAEDGEWVTEKPTFTAIGTYTVYYQITADSFETKTGSATVTITEATVTPTTHTVRFTLGDARLEVTSGQTVTDNAVAVENNGNLTFKLTVADDKEVKSVSVNGTALTADARSGAYTIRNITGDMTVTVTVGDKGGDTPTPPEPGEVDTTALEEAITAAEAALENITISDKAENAVAKDAEYYNQADVDALKTAIATAKAAKDAADKTDETVAAAKTALDGAVTAFRAAKKTGTMDDSALTSAIQAAKDARTPVHVIDDKGVDEVAKDVQFVTTAEMEALNTAIAAAETALTAEDKDQTTLDAAVTALNAAKGTFDAAIKIGTSETAEKPVVDTTALEEAITAAKAAGNGVQILPEDTDPATVSSGTKFTTAAAKTALDDAIAAAETAKDAEEKTDGSVANAVDALNAAVETFKAAIQTGTKTSRPSSSSSSAPAETTKTEVKEDGTKVTTVTKPDGTKVETTESPDGTKAVVETKKDGSKTETVTQPDGVKSEAVTTKDGDKTITVTDAEGEELVKVELPAEIPEPETKFEDVTETAPWAEEAINKVAGLKLMEGTGEAKYSPVAPMTRGSLATVLHRLSQGKTDYNNTFKDVAQGKYYTEGVAWAAKANVVKGISEDIFAPEKTITREQLAVMLARYAKLVGLNTKADAASLEKFADGNETGDWAVDGMAWCVEQGILQGKGNDTLDPTAGVSRAEVAVMLDRFIALIQK